MDFRKTKRFWGRSNAPAEPAKPQVLQLPAASAEAEAGPAIDFAKTQVLPVEDIAKVLQAYRTQHKPPAFDLGRTQKLSAALRKPRVRARSLVAAAALVLIVAAHAVLSTDAATTRRIPPETAHVLRPATAAAAAPTPNPPPAQPPAAALPAAPRRPSRPTPGVSPRKAVDALAAGDLARAAALYAALAERAPQDRAFATAARVLAGRLSRVP